MNRLQGLGPLQIENDIGVPQQPGIAEHDLILFAQQAHAAQIPDHRLYAVLGRAGHGPIFIGEIDFRLDAAEPLGSVAFGKHVREVQTGEAKVVVVNVSQVRLRRGRPG